MAARVGRGITSALAWLGLALLTASFVALVLERRQPEMRRAAEQHKRTETFALVVLDPGHGGADSGAIAGNVLEKNLTLDIAQRVDRLLAAQNVATLMTRTGDSYIALADRAAIANRADHAIFVSIHFNEGSRTVASGVETYFAAQQTGDRPALASWLPFLSTISSDQPNVESQSLAGFIQQELVRRTRAIDRGTKTEQFYVLANVRHPAALVEGGFLTNNGDVARLNDAKYREEIAAAISSGILRYREALLQRGQR